MSDDVRVPYADGCPGCVAEVCEPVSSIRLGHEMACRYVCRCGHRWTTRWMVGAVEGWDAVAPARVDERERS